MYGADGSFCFLRVIILSFTFLGAIAPDFWTICDYMENMYSMLHAKILTICCWDGY